MNYKSKSRLKAVACGLVAATLFSAMLFGCRSIDHQGTNPTDPGDGNKPEPGKAQKELENMLSNPDTIPISFKYEGKSSRGLEKGFTKINQTLTEETDGTRYDARFKHIDSGAEFRLDAKAYKVYDAIEWTLYITAGDKATGVFSDILACDMELKGDEPVLKGINGDLGDMYAPYSVALRDGAPVRKQGLSGRPTHGNFPYFNLEYGSGGSFIAVGWPGCWKASFQSGKKGITTVKAGQNDIATYLEPGETIRTPLVVLLRYEGRDEKVNMNLWRRWFIDCNMPRDSKGELLKPGIAWGHIVQGSSTKAIKRTINSYYGHGINLNYYWLDAGWYVNTKGEGCSWPETGMWKIDEKAFPDKFAEVSELMHEHGGKTMLWFEPEVVRLNKAAFLKANSDFNEEWMLGAAAVGSWLEGQLLNLGDPELRAWLEGRIFNVIDEGRIDYYRQDFNVDPAPVWQQYDRTAYSGKRTGFTENRYVQGYLQFWDDFLSRYPDMFIDSCASGGGRNDLETMRRSVPLHISDFWDGNAGGYDERQTTLMSVSLWFPFFKLQAYSIDGLSEYQMRSVLAPWSNYNVSSISKSTPWDLLKQMDGEHQRLAELYYKDVYQLTKVNKSPAVWRALEYNDPVEGSAAVMCFRGEKNDVNSMTFTLYGLNAEAKYEVKDCNGLIDRIMTGAELMNTGLEVVLSEPGSSALVFIKKQ
jgi:alpha-galactosidase